MACRPARSARKIIPHIRYWTAIGTATTTHTTPVLPSIHLLYAYITYMSECACVERARKRSAAKEIKSKWFSMFVRTEHETRLRMYTNTNGVMRAILWPTIITSMSRRALDQRQREISCSWHWPTSFVSSVNDRKKLHERARVYCRRRWQSKSPFRQREHELINTFLPFYGGNLCTKRTAEIF